MDHRPALCKPIRALMESQNVRSEGDIGAFLVGYSLHRRAKRPTQDKLILSCVVA